MIKFLLNLLTGNLSFLGMLGKKGYHIAKKPETRKRPKITSETSSFKTRILKSFFSQDIAIDIKLWALNDLKIHNSYLSSHLTTHELPSDF